MYIYIVYIYNYKLHISYYIYIYIHTCISITIYVYVYIYIYICVCYHQALALPVFAANDRAQHLWRRARRFTWMQCRKAVRSVGLVTADVPSVFASYAARSNTIRYDSQTPFQRKSVLTKWTWEWTVVQNQHPISLNHLRVFFLTLEHGRGGKENVNDPTFSDGCFVLLTPVSMYICTCLSLCVISYPIVWDHMVSYGTVSLPILSFPILLHHTVSYRMIASYRILWYLIVS